MRRTSGFSDLLTTIRFENAFLASPNVSNLTHFQHVLLTSFQVCFSSDCVTFLEPYGIPCGTIFRKKTLPKIGSKKRTPYLKTSPHVTVQGLLETPPRVRADSIQINSNQAQFNSIQFNSIQFKSSSNWKWLFELASKCEKMLGNGCLSWL